MRPSCGRQAVQGSRRKFKSKRKRLSVAVGVFFFPGPGGGDDFIECGVLRFPTERAFELFLAGNENGGIAGATRAEFPRNFLASDAFDRINDFKNGIAAAVADVESFSGNFVNFFERTQVPSGVG